MTALWRYKDTESVVRAMDGYTPGEGWVLYVPAQPAHTEQDVREILQTVQYKLSADRLEIVVRRILGVPK